MTSKLLFPELRFHAAHYLPGHATCGGIHGHTYYVRNLRINITMLPLEWDDEEQDTGISIDFGIIKEYFDIEWDHRFLVPEVHEMFWIEFFERTRKLDAVKRNVLLPVENTKVLRHTTAEWIATTIHADIVELLGWEMEKTPYKADPSMVTFELFEGPGQAITRE